jgi:hypothetical protein
MRKEIIQDIEHLITLLEELQVLTRHGPRLCALMLVLNGPCRTPWETREPSSRVDKIFRAVVRATTGEVE